MGIGHELKTFQHVYEMTVPLGIFRSWVKGFLTAEVWDDGGGKGAEKVLGRTATTIGLHPLSRAEEAADLAVIRELPHLSESRTLYERLRKFYAAWSDELPPYPVSKAPVAPARETELLKQYVAAAGDRRFPYPFYRALARVGGIDALPRDIREWFRRKADLEAKVQGPYELNDSMFVTHWLVMGYFPCASDDAGIDSDYLQSVGGEPRHVPDRELEIATGAGVGAKWVPHASPRSEIDFFAMKRFGMEDKRANAVAYAACWLKADKDTDCELRVDTMDDAYKLYLDHEPVEESRATWEAAMRQATCEPTTLTKGLHLLLIKVDGNVLPAGANNVYEGLFGFRLRVTDRSGGRPEGITVWN